jgi:hypothetical protein
LIVLSFSFATSLFLRNPYNNQTKLIGALTQAPLSSPPKTVDMRTFTTLAIGLVGAAVASASDVSALTKDTFGDFVKENDLVLAECKLSSASANCNP